MPAGAQRVTRVAGVEYQYAVGQDGGGGGGCRAHMDASGRGGLHAEWGLRKVGEYPAAGHFVRMASPPAVSTTELVLEVLGEEARQAHVQATGRAALAPLHLEPHHHQFVAASRGFEAFASAKAPAGGAGGVATAEYALGIGWGGMRPARMASGVFPGAVVYDEVAEEAERVQVTWAYAPSIHELGAYVQCFQGKIIRECSDAPPHPGWRDPVTHHNCSEYESKGWCRGRVASILGPKCVDTPGWVSRGGATCADYAARGYCADGGKGEMWLAEYGSFADWPDENGVDASKACCVWCADAAGAAGGGGCSKTHS